VTGQEDRGSSRTTRRRVGRIPRLATDLAGDDLGTGGGKNPAGTFVETWSRRWDSNPRPTVYETVALPLSYFGTRAARAAGAALGVG
jgi:hypothetical protein